jgi:acyl-CoA-dependent ceramide synthase
VFFLSCVASFRFIARACILKPIFALFSNGSSSFEKLQPSHNRRILSASKNRHRTDKLAKNKRQRYFEAGWYALWYPVSLVMGLYVLSEEEDLVRKQSNQQWGVLDSASWWHGWPRLRQDPPLIDNFYLVQLAFNVQCLIQIVLIESRKKDFLQMVSHHIITIFLIWSSYYVGFLRVGLIVMTVVADGPDLFLYWAKVLCAPLLAS